ncbi:OB-fold domain-containing protein [Streptomyces sp. NPDC008139]|uniref:Zn-ribbon domain-containing OB-fold protein n=1 Tax=Streptomyces sp. NPDC008139 TaxID=3364814 RepID=UPI0036ED00F4
MRQMATENIRGPQGTLDVIDVADTWAKPLPELDPVSTTYFRAAQEGTLLIQRCPSCHATQHYPRLICRVCAATPEWEAASGRGTVYTYTVVRQAGMPGFDEDAPYVIALVDLDEGPRMMGNITGCPVDEVRVGQRVQAYQLRIADGIGLPQWRPEATSG